MSSDAIGSPPLPLREAYVRAALALIVAGGMALQKRRVVSPATSENDITYYLVDEMARAQRAGTSAVLQFDPRVITKAGSHDPLVRGEIDIKFRWEEYPNVHERYLAVEAKRLRGVGRSLADKYVTEGVLDFITAKYSRGHDHGIMLGYVVVPPLEVAISKVATAMEKRRSDTHEQSPFEPDASLCFYPNTHRSTHIQGDAVVPITLAHVFLDFC